MLLIAAGRRIPARAGIEKGDRCALLAPNSIRWVALDLAMMAEGIIVVPLYARQAPAELVGDDEGFDAVAHFLLAMPRSPRKFKKLWPQAPPISLLESVFVDDAPSARRPVPHADRRGAGNDHLHVRALPANPKA